MARAQRAAERKAAAGGDAGAAEEKEEGEKDEESEDEGPLPEPAMPAQPQLQLVGVHTGESKGTGRVDSLGL